MSAAQGYQVRLTPWAARQLRDEMAWSRRGWGVPHQQAYRRSLSQRMAEIAADPYVHRERPELGAEIRIVHHRGLYIVFMIDERARQVEIVALPNVHRQLEGDVSLALDAKRRRKSTA